MTQPAQPKTKALVLNPPAKATPFLSLEQQQKTGQMPQFFRDYLNLTPTQHRVIQLIAATGGVPINTMSTALKGTLQNTPHLSTTTGLLGNPALANILMGTTRNLATTPQGARDRLGNYQMPVIVGPTDTSSIMQVIQLARKDGTLPELLAAFQKQSGKSLYVVLGERVRDVELRNRLLKLLPAPISEAQAVKDAFYENLAVGFSYSNKSGQQMNADKTPDPRRGGVSGELLQAFGYKAGDNLSGKWGFQMRVFTPDAVKGKGQPVIIAFRGTEGVTIDPKAKEGSQDSVIADFAKTAPGVNQFQANKSWIDAVVKNATKGGRKVVFVGHSLGGALAQEAAAAYPDVTLEIVTFQGANIAQKDVDKVTAYNKAHPKTPIVSRHYRVDGDIVPNSGEATTPGQITYFNRATRPAGSNKPMRLPSLSSALFAKFADKPDLKNFGMAVLSSMMPMFSDETFQAGHVVPSVSMYLQNFKGDASKNPQLAALLQYGIKDEQTVPHTLGKDGKPIREGDAPALGPDGKPRLIPAKQDVASVYAGTYTTKEDPRFSMEKSRSEVLPIAMDIAGGGAAAKIFQNNIAFNTVMHHLFEAAQKAKTKAEFMQQAQVVTTTPRLAMSQQDIALAQQLHLDESQRENAQAALKTLANVDSRTANEAALVGLFMGGVMGASTAHGLARKKYQEFIDSFPDHAVLDEYKDPKGAGYVVPIPEVLSRQIKRVPVLEEIWMLYHPELK